MGDLPALPRWLTDNGFPEGDINSRIQNGTTPLMRASYKADAGVVRLLIAACAQLDAKNLDGNNALWLACVSADIGIISILIEAGIDIDNQNDNGATALMYAASTGKAAVAERLLLAHPNIALETLDGFSAQDMAATVECLTLLRGAARQRAG